MKDKGGIEMKKIVAGILAAVIGVSVAASGAVKAGNRGDFSRLEQWDLCKQLGMSEPS